MQHTIHFLPGGQKVTVKSGTPLHTAAVAAGVALRSDCGNAGTCGKCKVIINGTEQRTCQTTVDTDLEIIVPEISRRAADGLVIQDAHCFSDLQTTGGQGLAIAFDLGTTTLVAVLLESGKVVGVTARANPQRQFGDDVISRIQKVLDDPGNLKRQHDIIIATTNEMLRELSRNSGCDLKNVTKMVVAGNTVMEHLFLEIDPSSLAYVPFEPSVKNYPVRLAKELGIEIAEHGQIIVLPVLGGFVGGDIVAGILATKIMENHENESVFFLDIGTNGEMALWHRDRLYAAATAAGPAFEGARIEFGSMATSGAIQRATFGESGDITLVTINHQSPCSICGSGLIDLVSEMLHWGVIKPTGQFNVTEKTPFQRRFKLYKGKTAFEICDGRKGGEAIFLTQNDIRQLQLATGAIRVGIQLLLNRAGISSESLSMFYVGGAFGSNIGPSQSQRIGLLPPEVPLERVQFCGNTSLAGAELVAFDSDAPISIQKLLGCCEHIDFASFPHFSTAFAESMIFPT